MARVRTDYPRRATVREGIFIPLSDGTRLAARIWLPDDAEADPVPAVLEFLPAKLKVATGTTVTWNIAGPEPHSVTFVPPGATVPPSTEADPSLTFPTPATAPYDGTTLVNSGVLPLGATDRRRYVGVYAIALPSGPRDFSVAEEGDHLTAQLAGQSAFPILYLGNDTFGVGFDRALRITFAMEGARATKLTLLQGGERFEGPRK